MAEVNKDDININSILNDIISFIDVSSGTKKEVDKNELK